MEKHDHPGQSGKALDNDGLTIEMNWSQIIPATTVD